MAQILTKVGNASSYLMKLAATSEITTDLREHIADTNRVVSGLVAEAIPTLESHSPELHAMIESAISSKRDYDRAWFVRLGYECVSNDWQRARSAMASAELSYASVVILDDIVDQGVNRFGKPCLYRSAGPDVAIYVAEMLRSMAALKLLEIFEDVDLPATTIREVLERNERALYDLNYGQYLDVSSTGREPSSFTDEDYLNLVHFTTGADVANCFVIGALLGGIDHKDVQLLEQIGSLIGVLMQIRDDILDYSLLSEDIDKTPGCDFLRVRMKLPYLVAHRFAKPSDKAFLESISANYDPSRWPEVCRIVASDITVAYIRDIARVLLSDLKSLLIGAELPGNVRGILLDFSDGVLSLG